MPERREGSEPQISSTEIKANYPNIEIPDKKTIEAQHQNEDEFLGKVDEAIKGAIAASGEQKFKKIKLKFSAFGYGTRVGWDHDLVIGGGDSSEKMIQGIIDNQDNKEVEFVPD